MLLTSPEKPGAPAACGADAPEIRSLCAFCPDLAARQAALLHESPEALVSHGCCWKCYCRITEELDGATLGPSGLADFLPFHRPEPRARPSPGACHEEPVT